jgi:hypothetical protein
MTVPLEAFDETFTVFSSGSSSDTTLGFTAFISGVIDVPRFYGYTPTDDLLTSKLRELIECKVHEDLSFILNCFREWVIVIK